MDNTALTAAFTEAVGSTKVSLYRIALSMMRNVADAEDAVSSALEITWAHRFTIRDPGKFVPYLMRTTVHACHAILRKHKREFASDDLESLAGQTLDESPMWEYLSNLPENYRLPLILRYGENMPEKEISAVLGLTRGTVSSRLSRGLSLLREQMKEE